ncbi:MAG: hypothetical protein NUV35_01415 [Syntrophomonadaceae bacterium]|nr:hypothetical protein [Syntrophomonadaceae bacterium]
MKHPTGESGQVLAAALVDLGILSVVALLVLNMWWTGGQEHAWTRDRTESQEQARFAVEYVCAAIRQSRWVVYAGGDRLLLVDGNGEKAGFRLYNGTMYRDFYSSVSATTPSASCPLAGPILLCRFLREADGRVLVTVQAGASGRAWSLETSAFPRAGGGVTR